jgi:hypothetical protein
MPTTRGPLHSSLGLKNHSRPFIFFTLLWPYLTQVIKSGKAKKIGKRLFYFSTPNPYQALKGHRGLIL